MSKKRIFLIAIIVIILAIGLYIFSLLRLSSSMKDLVVNYINDKYGTYYNLKLIGIGNKRNHFNIEFLGPIAGFDTDKTIKRYVYKYEIVNNKDPLYLTIWFNKNTKETKIEEVNGNIPLIDNPFYKDK